MWVSVTNSAELAQAKRWTVSYFKETQHDLASAYPLSPLHELVTERRSTIDPQQLGDTPVSYLGLENIRPLTGELVNFLKRSANSIKSRSKTFALDDVLYGRLRPELNKAFLAQGAVVEGICSGEFIVLSPNKSQVLPRYLRHILTSSFVTDFVSKYRAGASLPRIATEDLLSIRVPVPPLEAQKKIVRELEAIDAEIVAMRERLETLPTQTLNALLAAIAAGTDSISGDQTP